MHEEAKLTLREDFARVLANYAQARQSARIRGHALGSVFRSLSATLQSLPAANHLRVKWSMGQGNWATIPWVALLDSRLTDRVSRGVYVIYLFQADMGGVYLTLNQGTSELGSGPTAERELRSRAATLRKSIDSLQAAGFMLDHSIDFRFDGPVARAYKNSTIAHKHYAAANLPSDVDLIADLTAVCEAYAAVRGVAARL
jgi:5-methylcytosine-specific restriction enzyme B